MRKKTISLFISLIVLISGSYLPSYAHINLAPAGISEIQDRNPQQRALQIIQSDPNAWVVYSDMLKLSLRNDYYGSQAADHLIAKTLELIQEYMVKYGGVAYRKGDRSDEVVIVFPGQNVDKKKFSRTAIAEIMMNVQNEIERHFENYRYSFFEGDINDVQLQELKSMENISSVSVDTDLSVSKDTNGRAIITVKKSVRGILYKNMGIAKLKQILTKNNINARNLHTDKNLFAPYVPAGISNISDIDKSGIENAPKMILEKALSEAELQQQSTKETNKLVAKEPASTSKTGKLGEKTIHLVTEQQNNLCIARSNRIKNKLSGNLGPSPAEWMDDKFPAVKRVKMYDLLKKVIYQDSDQFRSFIIRGPPDNFYIVRAGKDNSGKYQWQIILVKQGIIALSDAADTLFQDKMKLAKREKRTRDATYPFKVVNDGFGQTAGDELIMLDNLSNFDNFSINDKNPTILTTDLICGILETTANDINKIIRENNLGFKVQFRGIVVNSTDFANKEQYQHILPLLDTLNAARKSLKPKDNEDNVVSFGNNIDNFSAINEEIKFIRNMRTLRAGKDLKITTELYVSKSAGSIGTILKPSRITPFTSL